MVISILILVLLTDPCPTGLSLEDARYAIGSKTPDGFHFVFFGNDLHVNHTGKGCTVVWDLWEEDTQYIPTAGYLASFRRFSVAEIVLINENGEKRTVLLKETRPIWALDFHQEALLCAGYDEEDLFVARIKLDGTLEKEMRFPIRDKLGQKNKVFSLFSQGKWFVWSARSHEIFVLSADLALIHRYETNLPEPLLSFDPKTLVSLFKLSIQNDPGTLEAACAKHRGKPISLFPTSFFFSGETLYCTWRFQELYGCLKETMVESVSRCLITKISQAGSLLGTGQCEDFYITGMLGKHTLVGRKWYPANSQSKGDWKYHAIPLKTP